MGTAKTYGLVSVVVTTRNEERNIGRLLESIDRQTYKEREVIVVDNESSDGTKEVARQFTDKVYNFGPERSAQRNFGVARAKGEYVLLLDADMELETQVLEECVREMGSGYGGVVIPEETVGKSWLARIRRFERQMYEGDDSVELARCFSRKVYKEMGGYDEGLTGPEDYDLHYRVSKKYKMGRIKARIFHHEEGIDLISSLRKKWYYANRGAGYAEKHPEMVSRQGTILFRKVYVRHWKKFFEEPALGVSFLVVRMLEMIWAVCGFIHAVGWRKFGETFWKMWKW